MSRRERADAGRNRETILATAFAELRSRQALSMRALASTAGVSRSTLYRHFSSLGALHRELREHALTAIREEVGAVLGEERAPLATVRDLSRRLGTVAAAHQAPGVREGSLVPEDDVAVATILPWAERLRVLAELEPRPPRPWLQRAVAQFVGSCLRAGAQAPHDPAAAAESVFRSVAESLDRGLLIMDQDGSLLSVNPPARAVLLPSDQLGPGRRPGFGADLLFEDGSGCPPEDYPPSVALRTGEAQRSVVRGHRDADGTVTWCAIDAWPLRAPGATDVYGLVAVLSDVTEQRDWQLARLRPPGRLGRRRPVPLDAPRVLDEIPPQLFPEQFVSEARRITGTPVALYVLDIDGTHLVRLAGSEEFPPRLAAPLALGPELAVDGVPDLRAHLETELPGVVMAPMWLRGRAVGILLAVGATEDSLMELAHPGAAAMELAGGYTDVVDAARRRKETSAAAELQQSLLPPRIARMGEGTLAGSVFPTYEVGGDWFDYVENRDGAWIAIADAVGKGPTAGALGGIALAALRAARRGERSLEDAAKAMHEAVHDVGRPEFFVTAIVARWHAVYSVFSWVNCGHPPPLVASAGGSVEQLDTPSGLPLGLWERERRFTRHQRLLEEGDRLILHSDGITARRTPDGLFGIDGVAEAVRAASTRSATAIARSIQEAVLDASVDPLQDDAVAIVLDPGPLEGRGQ